MSSLNLLLVVDEQDRMMLVEFLLRRDCHVQVVADEAQAIQTYMDRAHSTEAYDLVIADVAHPCNGISLAETLRQQHGTQAALAWITDFHNNNEELHRLSRHHSRRPDFYQACRSSHACSLCRTKTTSDALWLKRRFWPTFDL